MDHVKTRVWFTSDLLLGSERAAENRGFGSARAMDDEIVSRWNELVRPRDTVWILGNLATLVSVGRSQVALGTAGLLTGSKYLIAGPFDSCLCGRFPYASKAAVEYREVAGLKAVITGKEFINHDTPPQRRGVPIQIPLMGGPSHGHPNVVLSPFHYPEPDARDDDYALYRPKWEKRRAGQSPYLLHGEAPWVVRDYPPGKSLNVGMDAWGCEPQSAEMVVDLLRADNEN